jgi:hypothetical protein
MYNIIKYWSDFLYILGLAKSIFDYLLYVEHNPRKALELAAEAT